MQSYGLGVHEYFQLCEDLGAEPVPVLYAGLVCQARRENVSWEADLAPGEPAMEALIQDYLDLIEYAAGSAGTTWGAKRAANGHTAPFNLKKIGIGNENWGANYWRNFAEIRTRIQAVYPGMEVITTSGPLASGPIFNEAWLAINDGYTGAIVDEHYYMEPDWFLNNTMRYDTYRRNGVRIFVGEYAAHEGNRANTWNSALCEAAFITGLERNADIVHMASYAPLLARNGMTQWAPDMIWFDSGRITNLTPNYQIQKLFSANTGTRVLPPESMPGTGDLFHASSIDAENGLIFTKLVNPYTKTITVQITYANAVIQSAEQITLSGAQTAQTVQTAESALAVDGNSFTIEIAPCSVVIIRLRGNAG
jgi:alpha-N-arabinofuranosidase